MGRQLLIRDLEETVVDRLETRAQSAGLSLEQEVRRILTEAAMPEPDDFQAVSAAWRARFTPLPNFDVVEAVREDRDR
ncbi:FitA-like ribbon-helix-helix domain-containing protein [Azospirillum sp. sgz301742]